MEISPWPLDLMKMRARKTRFLILRIYVFSKFAYTDTVFEWSEKN